MTFIFYGYPSRIRTYGMSGSEPDALPLGYGVITEYIVPPSLYILYPFYGIIQGRRKNMKIVWLVTAIVLAIIEAATINLVTIWFIASALVSLLLAYLGVPTPVQIAVFVLLGVVLLVLTKKPLEKLLKKTKQKTNLDRVLDMTGIVTETIEEDKPGEVKVDGKRWTAIANTSIKEGSKVKILKIDGVKLIVEEEK